MGVRPVRVQVSLSLIYIVIFISLFLYKKFMHIYLLGFFFWKFLQMLVSILISVALLTLLERKILATVQRRRGPNVVGFFGLLQAFADGLKLFAKEAIFPYQIKKFLFFLAPILSLAVSLLGWPVIPFDFDIVLINIDLGLLYLFSVSSLAVYGIIFAGWSSNSKYAFLGSLRSAAQMISYEVSIGLIALNLLLCVGSLNLKKIVMFQEDCFFFFFWVFSYFFNVFYFSFSRNK
jgi:NADH-quinone oxidoreductase subunit H